MNLSLSTIFVIVTAVGALLAVVASPTWIRARRARRVATIDLLLATSYFGSSRVAASVEADPESVPASSATYPTSDAPRRDGHRALLDAAAFEEVLGQEDAREERYRRPTTVVMLELDGRERLVDRLGGEAAARLEPDVADTVARLARRADYVARLAPGRFAVLMPETDEIVAINYVERIRHACDEWLASGAIAMRLAIGWASTSGTASVTTAMQVAVDRMHAESRRIARAASDAAGGEPPAS